MRAFCVGFGGQKRCGRSSVLSTLLHAATIVFQTVPLMWWTGKQRAAAKSCRKLCVFRLWNGFMCFIFPTGALAVTSKVSTQIRSYSFHADSGLQWVCFESIRFVDLIVLERQVQATMHFCPFQRADLDQRTCLNCFSDMPNWWWAFAIEWRQLVQPSDQFRDQRKRRWLCD